MQSNDILAVREIYQLHLQNDTIRFQLQALLNNLTQIPHKTWNFDMTRHWHELKTALN